MGNYRNNPFAKPHGFLGRMAGWLMLSGDANYQRNAWAIQRMHLQSTDVILEIGFGPGVSIAHMNKTVVEGCIYGVDASQVMMVMASKRNRAAIENGKVKLFCASANNLPSLERKVDKVLTINSFEFWDAKTSALQSLKNLLCPDGRIFVVHQVQHKQGEPSTAELAAAYCRHLELTGFTQVKVDENLALSIACVTGVNSIHSQAD